MLKAYSKYYRRNSLLDIPNVLNLEVYKCIHELGPRYRHDMFSQKSRAYDYRDPSILTLPKYNNDNDNE